MAGRGLPLYALLWCLGIYFRLTVLIVPPLIPRLQDVFGFSTAQVAMATSLPSLLIGLGALIGGWLVARSGAIATVVAGLVIIGLGSSLRSLSADYGLFLAATAFMGAGIALLQTSLPTLSRLWLPQRVGMATAICTNGLLCGELIGASLTDPLAQSVLGVHWPWAFTLWALPIPVLIVGLIAYTRGQPNPYGRVARGGVVTPLSWRDPLIWRIALLLGSAGGLYLSGNIFLPRLLAAADSARWTNLGFALLNGSQLISSGLLVRYSDRLLGQRWVLRAAIGGAMAMVPCLLWLPGAGILPAAAVFGFCTSTMLTFGLTLPAWAVPTAQTPQLAAGAFSIGNGLVFAIPVIAGWAANIGGSVAIGFLPVWALAALALWAIGGLRARTA